MQNRLFIIGLFVCAGFIGSAQKQPPNFVFILTDDQSYGMMGCTGNELVQTPHLDQLAGEGVLFTNAHVTSGICTPSRASILLSEFERKHGINFNSGTSMNMEAWEGTYPMVMKDAGYYTGWVGKNHVPVGEGGYESGMMEKGFDYWYAGHGHLRFYPKEVHDIFKFAEHDTQAEVVSEGVQDFLSNEQKLEGAIKFLDQRPEERPFMLSVCFNLPHGAGTSTMKMRDSDDEIYKSLYRDQDIPMPDNYVAKANINNPKLPSDLLKVEERQTGYNYVDTPETNKERLIRQHQAMTGIDRMVGQLREKLKEEGLAKNTVLVFSSDHGLFMGEFGLGGKALCYEKVTHVPMIFFDPKMKKKNRAFQTAALVQTIDIAPTMLEMAGIAIPDSYQGKSLLPLLSKDLTDIHDHLYTENLWSTQFGNPRCEAVQTKEWKYIRYYENENLLASRKIAAAKLLNMPVNKMLYRVHDPDIALYRSFVEMPLEGEEPVYEELYNLKDDPMETTNLIAKSAYEEVLNELRQQWKKMIVSARGNEKPRVLRYTVDSMAEQD